MTDQGIEDRSPDELPALLRRDTGFIWVDIPSCDEDSSRALLDVFGFHPLAVRDCVERNRVPKVHGYGDHVLIVLHAPERGQRGHVHYIELDQIVSRNYLVTVHGPINPAVDPAMALRETRAVHARIVAGRFRPTSVFELSHAIVSALTRNQEAYVETMTRDVWQLEQRVTGGDVGDPEGFITDLFRARHGLLAVRTMAALGGAIYGRMSGLTRIPPGGDDARGRHHRPVRACPQRGRQREGVSPGRHRVLPDRADDQRRPGRPGAERRSQAAHRGQLRAERRDQEDLGVGRHLLRADPHRHGLRYELRSHAGTALEVRLSGRLDPDGAAIRCAVCAVQAAPMAVADGLGR